MQIEVLGCYGGESPEHRLTCLVINGTVALDAGCLARALPLERQRAIHSVVLSHSHIDHTNGLPFFVDNVFGAHAEGVQVHASPATVHSVRKNLFNAQTWPDFSRLPNHLLPAVRFHELEDEVPVRLGDVSLTPIPVNHVVPTHGFLIEQDGRAVLWSSDTGPTDRLWEVANSTRGLAAVCVDVSFDNSLQGIADDSRHLTPRTLESELAKLEVEVPILLHHLKPGCVERIREEVGRLAHPRLSFLEQGRSYTF